MRQFTLLVVPESGAFHPTDRALMDEPSVAREALLYAGLLADGTAVIQYRLSGDPSAAEAVLDGEPTTLSYDVFGIHSDGFYAHVQFESAGSAVKLLALADEQKLLVLTPFPFTDGGLRATLAGTQQRVRQAASMVPEDITVRFLGTEPYDPERDDLLARLTERQRDVLATAVELGYYETPRRATHADIAAVIGCSTGTVGEHLRKVEARVLSELVS
ncbi:MAG TPA: helix-turn-helix domain-containing protein [Halococcus sp.]|nr:helix-turn-helix domain-containing protein [Halococcus sp.]